MAATIEFRLTNKALLPQICLAQEVDPLLLEFDSCASDLCLKGLGAEPQIYGVEPSNRLTCAHFGTDLGKALGYLPADTKRQRDFVSRSNLAGES